MSASNRAARRAALARQQHQRDEFMWRQDQRRAEAAHRDLLRDADQADAERARTEERVRAVMARAQADAEKAAGEVARRYGAEERRLLGQPVTRYSGATRNLAGGLVVWHWRAACPPALAARLGVQRTDAGPLAVLRPGGGLVAGDSAPDVFAGLDATLLDDAEFMAWARTVAELWHGDVQQRYGILGTLRDDDWFARLAESAGIADSQTTSETLSGRYGAVERKVATVGIPSIAGVEIGQGGLELAFSHSSNASAAKWTKGLDLLRNGFRAAGMDSSNLRLADTADGGVVMRFDDAPSAFPDAAALPAPVPAATVDDAVRRVPEARWPVGWDARGNLIAPTVTSTRHCIAAGQPGVGKSVWVRSVVEQFRLSGWEIYLGDGKGSDYAALAEQPNVRMVSSEPAQHLLLVAEVCAELERRRAEAKVAKRTVAEPYARYPGILLVLDEFGTMKSEVSELDKKNGLELFMARLARIIRVGREARIVVLIAAQDVYADTIPVSLQDQFGLAVLLGVPGERTVMGTFVPESLRDDARRIGGRLTHPGRALYVDRVGKQVVEVQTPYSYSPGSVVLAKAPSDEVRTIWEQSAKVAGSLPSLYPRLGIKATADWRKGGAATIADTEVVVLTDSGGNLLAGAEKFDPLSDQWAGGEQIGTLKPRPGSTTKSPVTPPVPAPADITEMTDIERREAVRREAIRLGLLPADEVVEQDEQTKKSEENTTVKRPSVNGYSL
ncbi:type IV secretory system conjugative DNA transfer family protein [Mycobacteroides abscessus]|uniref:type IV secretory system conjugative DNA transfer family protein n=1 Tax=Mycobacteroides abscessus TaxID=36809 RepID=UPI00092AB8FF|nr:hypothetical protein [Mycobacteroides abscessus]SIE96515.1 FtsK/SpoIIIE family protein [Mycobacteroides abscessus subsp. abscessus]